MPINHFALLVLDITEKNILNRLLLADLYHFSLTCKTNFKQAGLVWNSEKRSLKLVANSNYKNIFLYNAYHVFAMGRNKLGQLGLGHHNDQPNFVRVPGLPQNGQILALFAHHGHTIIVFSDGRALQTNSTSSKFTEIAGLPTASKVTAVYADEFEILLTTNEGLSFTLRDQYSMQYGSSKKIDATSFTATVGLPQAAKITAIHTTRNYTLVVLAEQYLYAKGSNARGQLGLGDVSEQLTFLQIPGLPEANKIKKIYARENFILIMLDDYRIWATGDNASGQLGLGDTKVQRIFIEVPGLPKGKEITAIYPNKKFTFITIEDKYIYTAGDNSRCQLGLGNIKSQRLFIKIPELPDGKLTVVCPAEEFFSPPFFSLIIVNDDYVLVAGSNHAGQLGLGAIESQRTFVKVPGLLQSKISSIYYNESSTLLVFDNNRIFASGANLQGQLGLPALTCYKLFTEISGLSDTSKMTAVKNAHNRTLISYDDGRIFSAGFGFNFSSLYKRAKYQTDFNRNRFVEMTPSALTCAKIKI